MDGTNLTLRALQAKLNGSVQEWATYLILKLLYQNGLSRAIARAHCDSGYYTRVVLVGCTEEDVQKASLTPK